MFLGMILNIGLTTLFMTSSVLLPMLNNRAPANTGLMPESSKKLYVFCRYQNTSFRYNWNNLSFKYFYSSNWLLLMENLLECAVIIKHNMYVYTHYELYTSMRNTSWCKIFFLSSLEKKEKIKIWACLHVSVWMNPNYITLLLFAWSVDVHTRISNFIYFNTWL